MPSKPLLPLLLSNPSREFPSRKNENMSEFPSGSRRGRLLSASLPGIVLLLEEADAHSMGSSGFSCSQLEAIFQFDAGG